MRNEDTEKSAGVSDEKDAPTRTDTDYDVFLNGLKDETAVKTGEVEDMPKEFGGPKGLEPTRYGDWEANGRCYDF